MKVLSRRMTKNKKNCVKFKVHDVLINSREIRFLKTEVPVYSVIYIHHKHDKSYLIGM